jgi:hypothetical protein
VATETIETEYVRAAARSRRDRHGLGVTTMRWNLRMVAAQRGVWKASDLRRALAEAGLPLSAGKMSHCGRAGRSRCGWTTWM